VKALFLVLSLFLFPLQSGSFARAVRAFEMHELMAGSEIALIGKVSSVKRSGLTTQLTYPTWKGVTFEWLNVEVGVIESLKGTEKGRTIQILMLSAPGGGPAFNPPGMLDVKEGQHLLMFLLPTTKKGAYAAMSAPWDEDQAMFLLDRKEGVISQTSVAMSELIPTLVGDDGSILPDGVEKLRAKYKKQLSATPPKSAMIHLKWRAETSDGGWQRDVPDEPSEGTKEPAGPVTR
jgi:hypothetical protein